MMSAAGARDDAIAELIASTGQVGGSPAASRGATSCAG